MSIYQVSLLGGIPCPEKAWVKGESKCGGFKPHEDSDIVEESSDMFNNIIDAMKNVMIKSENWYCSYAKSFGLEFKDNEYKDYINLEFEKCKIVDINSFNEWLGQAWDEGFYLGRYARLDSNNS